jgi:hypothetical protein
MQALPHQIEDIVCEITAAMGALRSALNAVEDGGYPVDKLAEFNMMQGTNSDQQAEFAANKWRHEMAQEQFRLLSAVREQQLALSEISTQFSTELGFALASCFQKYCMPSGKQHSSSGSASISEGRRRGSNSKSPARGGLTTWGEEDGESDEDDDVGGEQRLSQADKNVPSRSDSVGSYESRDSYSSRGGGGGFGLMPRTLSKGVKIGAMTGKLSNLMKIRKPGFGSNSRKLTFTKLNPLPPGASRIRLEKAQMSVHHALVDFDPLFESVSEYIYVFIYYCLIICFYRFHCSLNSPTSTHILTPSPI